jgi:hypothetical protein
MLIQLEVFANFFEYPSSGICDYKSYLFNVSFCCVIEFIIQKNK